MYDVLKLKVLYQARIIMIRNSIVFCVLLLSWAAIAGTIHIENLRGGAVIGLLTIGVFVTLGGIHYFCGPARSQNLKRREVSDE